MKSSMVAMRYHIRVWQICGIWPPAATGGWRRFYPAYAVCVFGALFVVFPGCMVLNLLKVPNLSAVVATMLICSTCVLASVKGGFIVYNRLHIRRLFACLDAMDACLIDERQKMLIERTCRESRALIIMLSVLYYAGVNSSFALSQINEADAEPVLMWPSWYPGVPWQHGPRWVLAVVLAYQYVASIAVALLDSSVDLYGAALHKVLGAHIDGLALRLGELGGGSDGQQKPANVELHWRRQLRACVRHHQLCLRAAGHIDRIFSAHYLVQFACSGVILCVSAFQLSEINPVREWQKFMFVCEYLVSMAIEIFVPCYFGSVVTAKSERLVRAVYACEWPERGSEFRRTMGVLVERALRPVVPLCGGLVVVGLPTFVAVRDADARCVWIIIVMDNMLQILRAAYSLLSLLKSVDT